MDTWIIAVRHLSNDDGSTVDTNNKDKDNGTPDPYATQRQISAILDSSFNKGSFYDNISRVDIVNSLESEVMLSGDHSIRDRLRRAYGYRPKIISDKIGLSDNMPDTEGILRNYIEEYVKYNSDRILIILCGLPWFPALMDLGLKIDTVSKDMEPSSMEYMIPPGSAYLFPYKETTSL